MKLQKLIKPVLLAVSLSFSVMASANEVEIVNVKATQSSDKTWHFDVTLKHDDKGWDHYANEWQVIAPDNKILATRTLYHPHVKEQPFTRSISGVKVPDDIKTVRVIAKDLVHGLSDKLMKVNLQTKQQTSILIENEKNEKKEQKEQKE